MRDTYEQQLVRQMAEADCETYTDSNGEQQQSADGPDRIGDPPTKKVKVELPTAEEIAAAEEF